MAIDLMNLAPTTISRDLKGKYVCLYGDAGSGKTSLAASFPKNLLLGLKREMEVLLSITSPLVVNL